MNELINWWTKDRKIERNNERMTRINEWINEWMYECVNKLINRIMIEWIDELYLGGFGGTAVRVVCGSDCNLWLTAYN